MWLLLNQPNEDRLDVLNYCHCPSTPERPATLPELRHRYIAPNTVSNWANCLANHNVNPAGQPKEKLIPMNGTKASGSQTPQHSPLFLPGWSSSLSDISDDFDSNCSRIVSMTSHVDQGGESTECRIPFSIRLQGMLNTYRIMKQLSSPIYDYKARKRKAQFDVHNWVKCRSKMHWLVASAK